MAFTRNPDCRLLVFVLTVCLIACKKDSPVIPAGYDIDKFGIPRMVNFNPIEPVNIIRISRFRSSYGESFSDNFETCRSMKHAFEPISLIDRSATPVFSPVRGTVEKITATPSGDQIFIKPVIFPDFEFILINIKLDGGIMVGQILSEGQKIGFISGQPSLFEIAVFVETPGGRRLLSFFEMLAEDAFNKYREGGDYSREDFIISREERDNSPLQCQGQSFAGIDTKDIWVSMDFKWDPDAWGIPRFVKNQYIDVDRIWGISRFRSAVGHSYHDYFETCRSMKHYFRPAGDTGWETVNIYSPINGTLVNFFDESRGIQVWIRSDEYPDFDFLIFHITPAIPFVLGDKIVAGQHLGTHFSSNTFSDIAVVIWSRQGHKYVSFFETLTDSLFAYYQQRGIATRDELIINKAERDAFPLNCYGENFLPSQNPFNDWVYMDLK